MIEEKRSGWRGVTELGLVVVDSSGALSSFASFVKVGSVWL